MKISTILLIYLMACNLHWQYIWRSQERLWEHTLRLYPDSYRAHESLAKHLYETDALRALYHFEASTRCVDKSKGKWTKVIRDHYRVHFDKVIDSKYRQFRAGRIKTN